MIEKYKEIEIKNLIKNWLKRTFRRLINTDVSELYPNPFLMKAIGIEEDSREFYEFAVRQRLERSLSTSFGVSVFENIVKVLDGRADIEDIDLIIEKADKKYFIQLKSGPHGFTRPALRKTRATFIELKRKNPEAVTVIAFAYGNKEMLSPIWGEEAVSSADMVLVGEEFWDFFFGKGTYKRLLKLCSEASREALNEIGIQGENIVDTIVKRIMNRH